MPFCPGADKAAGLFPKTANFFLVDQPVDQRECITGIGQDPLDPVAIYRDGLPAKALADINAATDRTAISGAGAEAELVGLQNDGINPVLDQLERRRQPGIPAPDDRHARPAWHVDQVADCRCVSLPPIGSRTEIAMKDVGMHRSRLPGCANTQSLGSLPPSAI